MNLPTALGLILDEFDKFHQVSQVFDFQFDVVQCVKKVLDTLFAVLSIIVFVVELKTITKTFSCLELLTEMIRVDFEHKAAALLRPIFTVELDIERFLLLL